MIIFARFLGDVASKIFITDRPLLKSVVHHLLEVGVEAMALSTKTAGLDGLERNPTRHVHLPLDILQRLAWRLPIWILFIAKRSHITGS